MLSIARGGIAERGIRAPLLFSSEFRREQPERVERAGAATSSATAAPSTTIAAQTLASARFATTLRLERMRAPTLVMHGERDRLVPLAASRLLAARIPDAELAVVPGAGHAYAPRSTAASRSICCSAGVERRLSRSRPREEAHVAPDR